MFPPISISGPTQAGSTAVAVGSARCAAPRRGWRQSPARARCVTARSTGISILAVLVGTVIHQATFRVGRMGSWPFGQNTRTPAGQQFASFQRRLCLLFIHPPAHGSEVSPAVPWCTTPIEAESSLGPDSHHPIISVSGIPSAVLVLRILHPILASTLCAANPLARIAEPTIAL